MTNDLTLLIPAKNEKESIKKVLDEINKYNLNSIIILEKSDIATLNAINNSKNKKIKICFQKKNNKGYGNALKLGIRNCHTKYFCIFNADGSFHPKEIKKMLKIINTKNADFVFASRYEKNCGSDDDTLITKIGNYIFTQIGIILFNLNITDILYTFVLGKTKCAKKLNLKSNDFRLCVELPVLAKLKKMKLLTSNSHERARIAGEKKVNEFKDGFLILKKLAELYLKK